MEGTFQIRRLETGTVADKLYAKAIAKSVDQIGGLMTRITLEQKVKLIDPYGRYRRAEQN